MIELVEANIKVNLKFYRRNKLLIVSSIFIIGALGLSALPALFYLTRTKHLQIIQMLFSQLSGFATIVTAALGLLFMSYHLRNRTTKMVFTKPCSPEVWLLSGIVSATVVSLLLYVLIFTMCSVLFLVWGLPYQWALAFITINEFIQAIIILACITFLSVLFHPVIAVLAMVIVQESTLYYLKLFLMSGIKSAGEGALAIFLKMIKMIVDLIYMIIPTYHPFSEEMKSVYSSFRVSGGSWKYLLMAIAYTLTITGFLYLISAYILRKKRHT